MRNRPLCSVCLMVFLIFSIGMTAGGSRFFRELVPPEMKKQAGKEVQITGQVYQIEVRESYQILYLILSKKTSRILVYDDAKQPVQIGNKVNVKGELSLFEEARNPGNFDQKFYYEKQKIGAFLWAEALRVTDRESNPLKQGLYELRQKWKRILIDAAGEEDGGALAAILLGEKQGMDREIRELYQVNGIAHVLAVSGLHLSFLGVGVYHLLRRITGSYTVGGLAGILFLSAYILMIGMTVSAFRAMVMFLFRIGADLSGRHYDSPTALAAAAVIVCLWRPLSLYDSGFWLSFGALIAIIFILPILKNLPAQSLWASVSVNLFLLPILMYSFYEFSIYGVFLNLIIIPLLSVLMAAGLTGTMISLFWEHAGEAIFLCC